MKLSHKLIIALLSLFIINTSYAFQFNNNTSQRIYVTQIAGGKIGRMFKAQINPYDWAACNWQDQDCNASSRRDGLVSFEVGDPAYLAFHCIISNIRADNLLTITQFDAKQHICKYAVS